MITTTDIGDIMSRDCKVLGIAEIYRKGNIKEIPSAGLQTERVVILPKKQMGEKIWLKDFVEVNLCVPNLADGSADIGRLQELERMAKATFKHVTGFFDGTRYHYNIDEIDGQVEDSTSKCHFVNIRILFKVLNVN